MPDHPDAPGLTARMVAYLDVAVLAPVPRAGAAIPLLNSGDGDEVFRRAMEPTGARIETLNGGAGAAAERNCYAACI